MIRIAGVNILGHQHIVVALRNIFGIGPTRAQLICEKCKVNPQSKASTLSDAELEAIRIEINSNPEYKVEGDLRRNVSMSIKRLMDLGAYRGIRHRRHLPVRGQRTKTNARTRKGPKRAIK